MHTAVANQNKIRFSSPVGNFSRLPGCPIAYWVSDKFIALFDNEPISKVGDSRQGLITGNNDRFLRCWYEISVNKFSMFDGTKWFPYNKGGLFRKWYGNNDLVVNWENDGYEIKNNIDRNGKLLSRPQNVQYYFLQSITWTALTSGAFNARFSPSGFMFDAKGSSIFVRSESDYWSVFAYLNCKVTNHVLSVISPTLDYNAGVIAKLPYQQPKSEAVQKITRKLVEIAKLDYDLFETSWDFKRHPLI